MIIGSSHRNSSIHSRAAFKFSNFLSKFIVCESFVIYIYKLHRQSFVVICLNKNFGRKCCCVWLLQNNWNYCDYCTYAWYAL